MRWLITAGRKSVLSLYRPDIATMESGESVCNQDDATGFIELQRPSPPRKGDGGEAGEEEIVTRAWLRESRRESVFAILLY